MSLTREEWKEMWKSIKKIERTFISIPDVTTTRQKIRDIVVARLEVDKIKNQIESVIGQME